MNRKGKLNMDEYVQACALTQIVSVDLLVSNTDGKYLVGMRKNPPAKNTYFVPGCRAYKGENINDALVRTMQTELGCVLKDVEFYGMFEHFYKGDNPADVLGVDTHYVVFAYEGIIPEMFDNDQFQEQHADAKWMTKKELLNSDQVHDITKYYFTKHPPNCVVRFSLRDETE